MRKIIVSLFVFLFLSCFGYEGVNKKVHDDNKYTIILDQEYIHWFLGRDYTIKELGITELARIDSLMQQKIEEGELFLLEVDNLKELKEKYYRQYLCYENDLGHKVVYINSFCRIPSVFSEGERKELNWKVDMLDTSGGGNCYWSAKVDLTENKLFDIVMNSEE